MTEPKKPRAVVKAAPPDQTRERIGSLVEQANDALSYNPSDPANELFHLRMLTDPGILPQLRDGWRGTVSNWAVTVWDVNDEATGEILTLPSLALLTPDGQLVRLTGWPGISAWAQIVRACGADRIRAGIPVVIRRRASGTSGRSYWSIMVDAGVTLPASEGSERGQA